MTNEVKNVPELRFPEFEDEWVEKPLKDMVDVRSGKDYKHLNKGCYPVYGTGGYMISVDEYLYDGDAIGIGRKGTINKPYFLKGPFWTVDTLFYCVPKKNDTYFILNLFKNINWKIYDESTGVPSLSKVTINKIQRKVPANEEQQKIGDFFSKLDRQIELEEQKLAKLEAQKKGYMQKIFSQQLRFKNENGDAFPIWEESKLKEISNIKKGEQINKENITVNGKYYHLNGGITPSNRTNLYNTNSYTISISEGGNSCGFVKMNKEYFFSGGHNYTLLDLLINKHYLYTFLKYHEKNIMSLRVGSGLPNIQKKDISNYLIYIPCEKEQEKIGEFFNNLDEFIGKQSNKIELLKERKKGFLQKMFV
ncbi:restriction endonuclease subunit S [Staphylococcus arlettae]|uniref:restriction endonuclease subunit S n=1 Tax=Staphylococcus arlettae TaxID=29378 RepID=UPI00186BAC81|nr:restriction endonuclease subunit S [Staphylococcus arlettae]QZZ03617.1 restriction endonuclease subunit S [Staphylococcus arlettae]